MRGIRPVLAAPAVYEAAEKWDEENRPVRRRAGAYREPTGKHRYDDVPLPLDRKRLMRRKVAAYFDLFMTGRRLPYNPKRKNGEIVCLKDARLAVVALLASFDGRADWPGLRQGIACGVLYDALRTVGVGWGGARTACDYLDSGRWQRWFALCNKLSVSKLLKQPGTAQAACAS